MEPEKSFDEYFTNPHLSNEQGKMFNLARKLIHQFYPNVVERTSYSLPAFFPVEGQKATEVLLSMAANKNWLGVYALPFFIEDYADELNDLGMKFSKGAIQVPYNTSDKILENLIKAIIKYNLKRNGFKIPDTVK